MINLVHGVDKAYLHGEMGTYGYSHKPGKVAFLTSWAIAGELQKIQDRQFSSTVDAVDCSWRVSYDSWLSVAHLPIVYKRNRHCPRAKPSYQYRRHAANYSRPIAFGNFGYFVARFAGPGLMIEQHYDSATAVQNHYRYMGRMRFDSECIGPLEAETDGFGIRSNDLDKCPAFKVLRIQGQLANH